MRHERHGWHYLHTTLMRRTQVNQHIAYLFYLARQLSVLTKSLRFELQQSKRPKKSRIFGPNWMPCSGPTPRGSGRCTASNSAQGYGGIQFGLGISRWAEPSRSDA